MTRATTSRRLRATLALLATASLLSACEHGFFAPAGQGASAGRVRVAFSAAAVEGGSQAAFSRADHVHIRLTPSNEVDPAVDTTLRLAGTTSVDLALDIKETSASYAIAADVLLGSQPLFGGTGSVTLKAGETSAATIDLAPVPATIHLPPSLGTITAIGGTLQLTGALLFASGDTIPGATLTWTSLDPGVLSVTSSGVATGRSEGQARVRAQYQALSADGTVTIAAIVSSVLVSPAQLQLLLGATAQLAAVARDARGNALTRTFAWTSDNAAVATVDPGAGLVTARGAGSANIRASAGGVASAPVPVQVTARAAPPVISALTTLSVSVNDANCSAINGSLYIYQFAYADPNGDVPLTANLTDAWTFQPSGTSGSFTAGGTRTGDGFSGTISFGACYHFGGAASVSTSVTLADSAGLVSNTLTISNPAPVGANSAPGTITSLTSGAGKGAGAAPRGAVRLPGH